MRDHGGNLDWAKARWGQGTWVDLSTGINRVPYPMPALPDWAVTALPPAPAMAGLLAAAQGAWETDAPILALPGAQAAIQLIPLLSAPGTARVLGPTYNEHAACLRACGWAVEEVGTLADLAGADLAVVVNPNNPDGQRHTPGVLLDLLPRVGRLVVDESFADPQPAFGLTGRAASPGLLVLRSFGKFYGLAGLRLGFVLGEAPEVERLRALSGPWPVSGPAIVAGTAALADRDWAAATITRLHQDCARMDALAIRRGWSLVGGTELFRLYDTPGATEAQDHLARDKVWSRIFPWSPRLIRLGLPAPGEWDQVAAAFA